MLYDRFKYFSKISSYSQKEVIIIVIMKKYIYLAINFITSYLSPNNKIKLPIRHIIMVSEMKEHKINKFFLSYIDEYLKPNSL
jgi:hypothetical protein